MPIGGEYVVSAVLKQLKNMVPEISKRYREDQEQNIKRPCFFVKEMPLGQDKLMNNRYSRNYRIRITFRPLLDEKNKDVVCRAMGEKLLGVFRTLSLEGSSVFGRNLEFEVINEELLFTAEFPMHVLWEETEQPKMRNLNSDVEYKD